MKRPKLHIRDLFWLVLVAALICGWWLDQARIANQQRDLDQLKVAMEAEREALKADLAQTKGAMVTALNRQQAILSQMIERVSSQRPPEPKQPARTFPGSDLPDGMLILESEYHQRLIEGVPLQ